MLPPAAATTVPAVSASIPSASSRAVRTLVGDRAEVDAHAARGDRDQVGGTKSASTRNVVEAGGSSIVLRRAAAASPVSEVELVQDENLAVALDRRHAARADDVLGLRSW